MKKIIIIVAGVLLLLGGGGAGVYFLKPDLLPEAIRPKGKDAEHAKEAGEEAKQGEDNKGHKKKPFKKDEHAREVGADLDVFVVNLTGAGAPRYLRTMLTLGIKDEHDKEKLKELSGKIRHAVIMHLSEKKAEELGDPEGKNKLREELQKQIAEAIDNKELVTNVYFKEFLIQ